jgi:hypothetical protein
MTHSSASSWAAGSPAEQVRGEQRGPAGHQDPGGARRAGGGEQQHRNLPGKGRGARQAEPGAED